MQPVDAIFEHTRKPFRNRELRRSRVRPILDGGQAGRLNAVAGSDQAERPR